MLIFEFGSGEVEKDDGRATLTTRRYRTMCPYTCESKVLVLWAFIARIYTP
jgi:hypothetical protein